MGMRLRVGGKHSRKEKKRRGGGGGAPQKEISPKKRTSRTGEAELQKNGRLPGRSRELSRCSLSSERRNVENGPDCGSDTYLRTSDLGITKDKGARGCSMD